jgi:two-component system chemotaxis sensor kinase CheA
MVRIQVSKLDARMNESDEMLAAKLMSRRQAGVIGQVAQLFEQARGDWTKIELRALEQGSSAAGTSAGVAALLKTQRERFEAAGTALATLAQSAQQDARTIGKLVDNLLQGSRSLLLMPFSTLSTGYPGMVADLCRDLGKQAAISLHGESVELDKRILDELKDPLLHLLRNCLDHGIEPPDERVRRGKPAQGTVSISASHGDAGKVDIVVTDDGGGIDAAAVRAAAVRHGLLNEEEAARLGDAESRELIFRSAISTRATVTRLSGRGLGLAIVREKVEKLGGRVAVDSVPGRGTTFRMSLPVLMAAFRGVLVEACGRCFVAPSAHVERVARVASGEVKTVEGRESVAIAGKPLMLARLGDLLEIAGNAPSAGEAYLSVLVLVFGGQRIACAVDAILGEQEVLVKPLKKPLVRVRNISGATVLESGRIAPVLNIPDLLRSTQTIRHRPSAAALRVDSKKAVLVAEDSITSRMLIAGILEAAGYQVSTAVDGIDAITQLRSGSFDLLVSDVDMPRLDGFGLTSTVRADKRLADLPIVLVTARETNEDRERGVDAGANAYIVKRSLEQSGLLEAVRRLL